MLKPEKSEHRKHLLPRGPRIRRQSRIKRKFLVHRRRLTESRRDPGKKISSKSFLRALDVHQSLLSSGDRYYVMKTSF